jgi:hypothetical protein
LLQNSSKILSFRDFLHGNLIKHAVCGIFVQFFFQFMEISAFPDGNSKFESTALEASIDII